MTEDFDWMERDRGILNERDRELLTGSTEDELSTNAWNQRRYNIRNRIENSIYDFYLLARYLPVADIEQVFEPAYEWSRNKRELNEQGRNSASPKLPIFLLGWLSAFEFYSYGMHAGGKAEARAIMQDLVSEGLERGSRGYQVENHRGIREVSAITKVDYHERMSREDYLFQLQSKLPNEPNQIAEQIMRWYNQRRISHRTASVWIEEFVQQPSY